MYVNNDPCIIAGDFNAHNIIWNSSHNDVNDHWLANTLDDTDLFIRNTTSLTHILIYTKKPLSNIDLILSSLPIADTITTDTLKDTLDSDRFPIRIVYKTEKYFFTNTSLTQISFQKKEKTDWTGFPKYLEDMDKNHFSFKIVLVFGIDEELETFN